MFEPLLKADIASSVRGSAKSMLNGHFLLLPQLLWHPREGANGCKRDQSIAWTLSFERMYTIVSINYLKLPDITTLLFQCSESLGLLVLFGSTSECRKLRYLQWVRSSTIKLVVTHLFSQRVYIS